MTTTLKQDEIIEMAESAGMTRDGDMWFTNGESDMDVHIDQLEAFAKLVAAKEREEFAVHAVDIARRAVAEEREACAKYVDHILKEGGGTYGDAIRARGEQHES